MSSHATQFASRDPEALTLVRELQGLKGNVEDYRSHMKSLGQHLGRSVLTLFSALPQGDICVVCTVEDADFLAQGVIDALESAGLGRQVRLICLWNERVEIRDVSLSPIVKQYREDFSPNGSIFVIVKSIISGACVVKTNLMRALSFAVPERIFVAAPVMLIGAEDRLKDEFPATLADSFEFVHYVTDTIKNGDEVVPGIGGSVYENLGLGNSKEKNSYLPQIVDSRRKRLFAVCS